MIFRRRSRPAQAGFQRVAFAGGVSAMLLAPTGSGKFSCSICMTCLHNRTDNLIVFDPAGQACAVCARYRRSLGHRVVIFNPFNELPGLLGEPVRVNPLGELDPSSLTFVQDVRDIAAILKRVESDDKQKFFVESAQDVIGAVGMHIRITEGPQATLQRVNQTLHLSPADLNQLFGAMRDSPLEAVRQVGTRYYVEGEARERASVRDVIDTARSGTRFLADPPMINLFSGNDFSWKTLKHPTDRTTVFIVWPALKASSYAPAAELLLCSAMAGLMTWPPAPCLLLVDEMPTAMQRKGVCVDKIRDVFTNGRKVGLKAQIVAQDFGQFLGMFQEPDDAYTLLNNAGVVQFYGTGAMDTVTQDLILQQAGNRTIWAPKQHEPVFSEDGAELLGWSPQRGEAMPLPLLTRADLREMHGNGLQIDFLMGCRHPILMPRTPHYYQVPALKALLDPDPYHVGLAGAPARP